MYTCRFVLFPHPTYFTWCWLIWGENNMEHELWPRHMYMSRSMQGKTQEKCSVPAVMLLENIPILPSRILDFCKQKFWLLLKGAIQLWNAIRRVMLGGTLSQIWTRRTRRRKPVKAKKAPLWEGPNCYQAVVTKQMLFHSVLITHYYLVNLDLCVISGNTTYLFAGGIYSLADLVSVLST